MRGTDLVATPEQRASVFSATRSPRRSLRTGPLTVATWAIGVKEVPSWRCHVTLIELRPDYEKYEEFVIHTCNLVDERLLRRMVHRLALPATTLDPPNQKYNRKLA